VHDPHGFPYARLPVQDLMQAWKATGIAYGKPYMLRANFRRVEHVSEEDMIRRSLGPAREWLSMETHGAGAGEDAMPLGSVGNGTAAKQLARMIQTNCTAGLRAHMVYFAVRVGARRLVDGATCLAQIGYRDAAGIMGKQSRLVGSLQYILVQNDFAATAETLDALADTYQELQKAMKEQPSL